MYGRCRRSHARCLVLFTYGAWYAAHRISVYALRHNSKVVFAFQLLSTKPTIATPQVRRPNHLRLCGGRAPSKDAEHAGANPTATDLRYLLHLPIYPLPANDMRETPTSSDAKISIYIRVE
jgi:hypothetical protein